MAFKLTHFTIFRRCPRRVFMTSRFFAGACTAKVADASEIDRQGLNLTDFDFAVCFLKKKLHPDSLTWVLGSIPDLDSAVSLFRWASTQKRFRYTGGTYTAVILRLGLAGSSEEMCDILKEMIKVGPPDLDEALDFLIRTFVRNGMAKQALRVFEVACSAHHWPQISLCNELLRSLVVERGNFERVVFVYKEMVKGGLPPDVDTLNYLIEVLLETGRVDSALEQFRRMPRKRCSPNSRTFELIIGGLCLGRRVEDSRKILLEMSEMGVNPDATFYHHVVPLLCNVDRLEEALELVQSMRASEIMPDSGTFAALVHSLSQKGLVDNALELFEEMSEKGLPLSAGVYADITLGYCKLGSLGDAADFLEMHPSSEVGPYNALLKCYCDVNRFQEAVSILQRLLKMNLCDNTSWNILIGALCRKGYIKLAYSVLARMTLSSYMVDEDTYSAMLSGHCRQGDMKHAMGCVHWLCDNDWFLDAESYNQLIVGFCGTNNVSEATELFHYMSSKGGILITSSLDLLVSGVCLVGNFSEAIRIRLLAACTGYSYGPDISSTIMQHFLAAGKSKYIQVLFAQMLVEGCIFDARAHILLLRGLLMENMIREVILLFDVMISDSKLPDPEFIDNALSHLSEHCQLHSVIHVLDKLFEKIGLLSPSSCNLVIAGLLKEDHRSEACTYLKLMLDRGWVPDVYTHGLLFGKVGHSTGGEVAEDGFEDAIDAILAEGLNYTGQMTARIV